MKTPTVSIGLPVYNGGKYLTLALRSILQQDYTDFELVISDNASTDGTEEIARRAAAVDDRIRYYRNEANIGASGNYRRVFELARGRYFKWASHDDEFDPSLLRRCLEAFEECPAAVLAFSKAEIIDEYSRRTCQSPDVIDSSANRAFQRLASLVLNRRYAHPLWGLIRTETLRKTRLMGCVEADHVLLMELVLLGKCVEVPDILYRQRRHSGSAMAINRSTRELMAWHDPEKLRVRWVLPKWLHLWIECHRAVQYVPLQALERVVCHAIVMAIPCWRWLLNFSRPVRHGLGLRRPMSSSGEGISGAMIEGSSIRSTTEVFGRSDE